MVAVTSGMRAPLTASPSHPNHTEMSVWMVGRVTTIADPFIVICQEPVLLMLT